jgi:uncharacterized protein
MIKFRPHHFLCALGFKGKGYSPRFIHNFTQLVNKLNLEGGDDVLIEVVSACDDICNACPARRNSRCQQEERIKRLDRAHAAVLGLKAGAKLSWGRAKALLRDKMTPEQLDKACAQCRWKELGYCRLALEALHDQAEENHPLAA